MIIHLAPDCTESIQTDILCAVRAVGYTPTAVQTQFGRYIVCIGKQPIDIRVLGSLPGVRDIYYVSDDYQLVSRKWKLERTTIDLGDGVTLGNGAFQIMAGPCSIESEEQVCSIAQHLQRCGVRIMRGGVFKPRSSPYSFRGLGLEGLKIFARICREHGIKVISEVMEAAQIEPMYEYIDIYQVGARNSQNFNLLDELGKVDKPVMIKRGISGTIEELLYSAEYVFSAGNERLLLCERGIRTYERASRNTFDINAIPILQDKSHLPVIVDPSHAIGLREFVAPVALAGVAAGADGIIVEVHETPEEAASDGAQTLNYEESEQLFHQIRALLSVRQSFS
ncbi:MAG: bifunctional 3-deoxy-7-phosphoheptulonate synthase/chorismate mutase [Bacteroidota bacterium]|nr:bifunctional 3-deoxy-7-phosphoheptulonate synthase/chorismate mutase [Candidatus Kapabacteria bacterium]MDW8220252.1 bifunctional 3-deoxy-7-phosphoheptulonate synthase/chorismate mutase [Bacteroidota bacterium]